MESQTVVVDIVSSPESLPQYATPGSAALDLKACLDRYIHGDAIAIYPGRTEEVPLGIAVSLPSGTCGLVLPRSGLASRYGITLANSVGLVDIDFRGLWKAYLHNQSANTYWVKNGDRIAQLLVVPFLRVEWNPVEQLDETERGEGGFGSTGR